MSSESALDPQTSIRELDKKLWTVANRLSANLDAVVYEHAFLALTMLKYVSNSLPQCQQEVGALLPDPYNSAKYDVQMAQGISA